MIKKDSLSLLKLVALFEGTSLILLFLVALPLKYWAGMPIFVSIVGPIHGVLVMLFVGLLIFHYLKHDINLVTLLVGIFASFIIFGTFVYSAKMLNKKDATVTKKQL